MTRSLNMLMTITVAIGARLRRATRNYAAIAVMAMGCAFQGDDSSTSEVQNSVPYKDIMQYWTVLCYTNHAQCTELGYGGMGGMATKCERLRSEHF